MYMAWKYSSQTFCFSSSQVTSIVVCITWGENITVLQHTGIAVQSLIGLHKYIHYGSESWLCSRIYVYLTPDDVSTFMKAMMSFAKDGLLSQNLKAINPCHVTQTLSGIIHQHANERSK